MNAPERNLDLGEDALQLRSLTGGTPEHHTPEWKLAHAKRSLEGATSVWGKRHYAGEIARLEDLISTKGQPVQQPAQPGRNRGAFA